MKEDPAAEKVLLAMVSEGDPIAFRKIYESYYDHVYNAAFSFLKSDQLTEDVVQEVFLKVWSKREVLTQVEKFDAWLFIMARNHILTEFKSRLRFSSYVEYLKNYLSEAGSDLMDEIIFRDSDAIIRNAVEKLPEQQKTVFRLSRDEGLSQEEIAEKMAISKNTVRNHMNSALKYLRRYILASHRIPLIFIFLLTRT